MIGGGKMLTYDNIQLILPLHEDNGTSDEAKMLAYCGFLLNSPLHENIMIIDESNEVTHGR